MEENTMTNKNDIDEGKEINKTVLITVMMMGAFVAILNETIMNVALVKIMEGLQITASTAQWLTTSFMLVIAILIPVTAFLIERYTTRQLFLTAMSLFTAGTFIAAVAPNFVILLIGRLVQAAGTGLILPLLFTVVLALIPPEKRGTVMGRLGLVIMFAPAVGPTVSGLIVEHFVWRYLFVAVLPISLFVLIYSAFVLKNVTETTNPKIDVLSIIFSTVGFGGVVFGFANAGVGGMEQGTVEQGGWASPQVIISMILGFIGIVLFTWRQLKLKTPMLDLRAFRYPMFTLGLVIIMVAMMAMFAAFILLPMFLQQAAEFTPLEAGLLMLPGGVLMGIMSPITGKLFDKFGAKWLAIIGLSIMIIALVFFSNMSASMPFVLIMCLHSALMLGISLMMMPSMTMGLNQLPQNLYSHGTAIMNTLQQVAGAIGTALLITVMSTGSLSFLQSHVDAKGNVSPEMEVHAMTAGVNDAFALSIVMVGIALVLSLFIKRTGTSEEYTETANSH